MKSKKPFKTIEEHLSILEDRGVLIEDRAMAGRFLLRNNYYSVINGYKEFFLDPDRCNQDVEVYRKGTRFEHITTLYSFDTVLRFSMMHSLTTAEKAMKTATVHAFCERYRGPEDYLDPACYCPRGEYRGQNYTKNLIRLLSTLQTVRDGSGGKRAYIEHYRKNYSAVPFWVLSGALTFGNMSHFYDLQRLSVQNGACNLLCLSTGRSSIKARRVREIYSTLTDFRNVCAHGGRLFCFRGGAREDKKFSDMLESLSLVSTLEERRLLVGQAKTALDMLNTIPKVRDMAERRMGINAGLWDSLLE